MHFDFEDEQSLPGSLPVYPITSNAGRVKRTVVSRTTRITQVSNSNRSTPPSPSTPPGSDSAIAR
jgi:hypothetical protein